MTLLEKMKEMVKQYPNNMELGRELREFITELEPEEPKQVRGEDRRKTDRGNDRRFNKFGEPEEQTKYIYERNPDTGQVYRRKFGDYETPREPVDSNLNPLPTQLNLFPPNDVY